MAKSSSKLFFGIGGKDNNPNAALLSLKKSIATYLANTTKFINNRNNTKLSNKPQSIDKVINPQQLLGYTPIKKSNLILKNMKRRSNIVLLDVISNSKQKILHSSSSFPMVSIDLLPSFKSPSQKQNEGPNDPRNISKIKLIQHNSNPKTNMKRFAQSNLKSPNNNCNNLIENGFFSKTNITKNSSFTPSDQNQKMKRCLSGIVITSSLLKERDLLSKINEKGQIPFLKLSNKIIKDIKRNYKKMYFDNDEKKNKRKLLKERNEIENLIDYKKKRISHSQSALIQLENNKKIKTLEKINDQVSLNHINFLESMLHLNYGFQGKFEYEERKEINKKLNNDSFVYVNI